MISDFDELTADAFDDTLTDVLAAGALSLSESSPSSLEDSRA